MHLVIINGSPRRAEKSNTERIVAAFRRGLEGAGNTCELWHLSAREEWQGAREAFGGNDHILFALPLYVENIPGIMLEFLEGLPPKETPGTKAAFLIQGGFDEAVQASCAKAYVETLPTWFGCEYAGTLTKGGLFGVGFLPKKMAEKQVAPFAEAGAEFAREGGFSSEYAAAFAGPEYYDQATIQSYQRFGRHISKFVMGRMAKKLGCTQRLDARPYLQYLK